MKIKSLLLIAALGFVTSVTQATDVKPSPPSLSSSMSASIEEARIKKFTLELQQKFPMTANAKVTRAFGDFYSVVRGNEVLFINEDLSILINGDVMDLRGNKSLTASLRNTSRDKINVADLNLKDAIKFGNGQNVLYVFSDPDCPFCRQLETELDKLQDVSVYVFPFPISGLHPTAAATAESIWCAKDRAEAWRNYMTKGEKPIEAKCANPIERNIAAAGKYQLYGTPAIIFSDGAVVPGKVPASVITAQIAASKKQ
jgi:thiol:disulfide interchange protein DsbC